MVAGRVLLAAITLWIIVFALKCKLPKRWDTIPRLLIEGCFACVLPYTLLAHWSAFGGQRPRLRFSELDA